MEAHPVVVGVDQMVLIARYDWQLARHRQGLAGNRPRFTNIGQWLGGNCWRLAA